MKKTTNHGDIAEIATCINVWTPSSEHNSTGQRSVLHQRQGRIKERKKDLCCQGGNRVGLLHYQW